MSAHELPEQTPGQDISPRIAGDPQAELALRIITKLNSAGHTAYLAGGCVRDALLGRAPKDYDVATSALPNQIRELFGHRNTLAIGAAFGVISVLDQTSQKQPPVEVATFRCDGNYRDGRRPDSVKFSTPELDAQRRDFTINGLFYDPVSERVLDFVGGVADLASRHIRAIGDPTERFNEDRLRLLRAIRFAATYQFSLDGATRKAIADQAAEVVVCSGERIGAEMQRMLRPDAAMESVRLLRETGLAAAIMPAIDAALRRIDVEARLFSQLKYHQNIDTINAPDAWLTNLALLIECTGDQVDNKLNWLAQTWHLSNEQRDSIRTALLFRDDLLVADQLPWSQLQPMLVHRYRDAAIAVARVIAEYNGQAPHPAIERIDRALYLSPAELDPQPLLTGDDLIRGGMRPGPEFKSLLQSVRDAQLNGLLNTKAEAQQWLKR